MISGRSELEDVIDRDLKTFVEVGQETLGLPPSWQSVIAGVGKALCEIRDSRLYREEFSRFEDYCLVKWEMTDRTARKFIDACSVVEELQDPTGPIGPLPSTESQARELAPLLSDPELVRTAWKEAVRRSPEDSHCASVMPDHRALTPPL